MGFFSSSNSEKCVICEEQNSLSKYVRFPVTQSRIIADELVSGQRGQDWALTSGEIIDPSISIKMGPFYFYWVDMSSSATDEVMTCSRKCACQFAKEKNAMLMLHADSGAQANTPPIFPDQLIIDQYKYDNNIS